MNTHSFRSMFSRQNVVPFTFFFLLIIIVVFGFTASVVQSSATVSNGSGHGTQKPPSMPSEDIAKEFNDDDLKVKGEKPRGKWAFATVLDMSQFESNSIPVAVGGIQSLSGGGRHSGITKIKRVEIKNRSPKIVSSIQLKWTLAPLDDPEKVLSEGTTQFANVWVEANSSQVVEIPTLYPALLLKSLAKDGKLSGRFQLTIGVQEARFADGSFWRRQETAAYLKFLDSYRALDSSFPSLASLALGIVPPRAGTSNEQISTSPSALESRSTASAFFLIAAQTLSCRDNTSIFEDEEGKRSCENPAFNIACYSNCSPTGHCITWTKGGQCDPTPTPTPTPPPCPSPQPSPCCEEEYVTFPGTQIQDCRWNCQPPNCETGTVFADGCYSVGGPVVCPDGYEFTSSETYGPACSCSTVRSEGKDSLTAAGGGVSLYAVASHLASRWRLHHRRPHGYV